MFINFPLIRKSFHCHPWVRGPMSSKAAAELPKESNLLQDEHLLISSTVSLHLIGSKDNQYSPKISQSRISKPQYPCRSDLRASSGLLPAAGLEDTSRHIPDLFLSNLRYRSYISTSLSMLCSNSARYVPLKIVQLKLFQPVAFHVCCSCTQKNRSTYTISLYENSEQQQNLNYNWEASSSNERVLLLSLTLQALLPRPSTPLSWNKQRGFSASKESSWSIQIKEAQNATAKPLQHLTTQPKTPFFPTDSILRLSRSLANIHQQQQPASPISPSSTPPHLSTPHMSTVCFQPYG
jgi:hypothetical protein